MARPEDNLEAGRDPLKPDPLKTGESDQSDLYVDKAAGRLFQDESQTRAVVETEQTNEHITPAPNSADPFAQFEEDLEGDATQIDAEDELPEQSTSIMDERPAPLLLWVESGKDKGTEFVLHEGENSLGRGIDNDIVLSDAAVSRRHLKFIVAANEIVLRDLGSGNGTLLNAEKVFTAPIFHGDRIEIGGTVMVLRVPNEHPAVEFLQRKEGMAPQALPEPPPLPGVLPLPGVPPREEGVPLLQSEPLEAFVPVPSAVSPETGHTSSAVVIPRQWLMIFLGLGALLIALLAATLTAIVIRHRNNSHQESSADAKLDRLLDQGRAGFAQKKWDFAEQSFSRVLARRPGDRQAMDYLQRIRDAREHEPLVASARAALRIGDAKTALNEAASIPPNSPLAAEAEAIRLAARAKQISDHIEASERARKNGNLAEAERRLNEARNLDPEGSLIKTIEAKYGIGAVEEETSDKREPAPAEHEDDTDSHSKKDKKAKDSKNQKKPVLAPEAQPPVADKSADVKKRVLAAYREGDFAGAAEHARSAGSDNKEHAKLGDAIDRFAELYGRIQAAGTNVNSVARQMHTAILLDKQISGGFYAGSLSTPLVEEYLKEAKAAWTGGKVAIACQRVRQAMAIQEKHSEGQRLSERCEGEAKTMLQKAESLQASNVTQARSIYREILTMVPQNREVHRKAFERLEALAKKSK